MLQAHKSFVMSLSIALLAWFITGVTKCITYNEQATLFTTVLMAGLWITEAIHTNVTALVPLVLLPLFGVCGGKDLAKVYYNNTTFILLGSYLLSIALQEVNGAKRVSLMFLSRLPGNPMIVLVGFMCLTAFLSMFMSNTAAAALVVPAVMVIYEEVKKTQPDVESQSDPKESTERGGGIDEDQLNTYFSRLMLGVAYAASCGGMATLTGTPANLVFADFIHDHLPDREVSYGGWMLLGLPVCVGVLFVLILLFKCLGLGLPSDYRLPVEALKGELKALGKVTFSEIVVYICLLVTILAWVFRHPGFMAGWTDVFPQPSFITDGTIAMLAPMLFFLIPKTQDEGTEISEYRSQEMILEWGKCVSKIPFGLFLLYGSGNALSKAFEDSGLSVSIGDTVGQIADWPIIIIAFFICVIAGGLSQITSNTATITILLPVFFSMAQTLGVDPYVTTVPATLAVSLPFMLPISTPPNLIAYQTNFLKQPDFVKIGGLGVLIGIFVVLVFTFGFGLKALGVEEIAPGN